jgi:iron complex outermembrane receptor protein
MHRKSFWLATSAALGLAAAAQAQPVNPAAPIVDEIIVTGTPFAVEPDALTSNVDVLTRETLDLAPPAGLGDVLSGLPGVRSTFFGPGASRPVIRGLSGPRVLVLSNGVGQVDASALSPDHAVASDPLEARRIEVIRGPATLAYGGSAIGGVVNVIDDRIPETPAADGVDGRATASVSSVDDGRTAATNVKLGRGPWVVAADAVRRESDDYAVPVPPESRRLAASEGEEPEPADTVENSAVELTQYGVGVSYVTGTGFFGVSVRRTDTLYGAPGHAHEHEHAEGEEEDEEEHDEEEDVRIDLEQTRVDLRGESDIDFGPFSRIRFTGGYAEYEHTELEGAEIGTVFTNQGAEGRLELVQRERDGWEGAIGVQALTREFDAVGEEAYVGRTDISEVGAFTLQRVDRGGYGFEGGVRIDRRSLDNVTFGERSFSNVSASAGTFVRPSDQIFAGVNLSRNARAPTEAELFAQGPHIATRAFEIGDQSLDSEVSYSLDAALHFEEGPVELDAHAFIARYQDFIDLRPTGEVDEESELPIFVYRQTDATFHGFELEYAYAFARTPGREWRAEAAYDYVRGDTELGPTARIPPWSLTGRLVHDGEAIDASLEVRHVAEQDRVADFELPTDAYTLVNALVSARPFGGPLSASPSSWRAAIWATKRLANMPPTSRTWRPCPAETSGRG